MTLLKTILHEGYGLFVDDGSFAVAILVWLGLDWLIVRSAILSPALAAVVLFAGLALILVESAARRARRS